MSVGGLFLYAGKAAIGLPAHSCREHTDEDGAVTGYTFIFKTDRSKMSPQQGQRLLQEAYKKKHELPDHAEVRVSLHWDDFLVVRVYLFEPRPYRGRRSQKGIKKSRLPKGSAGGKKANKGAVPSVAALEAALSALPAERLQALLGRLGGN